MRQCGFSAEALRAAGFSVAEVKEQLKMTAKELYDGGYPMSEIKAARFDAWQLKELV